MRAIAPFDADAGEPNEAERRGTGGTFRDALNRLLRRAVHRDEPPPPLPILPGALRVDIADVSAVLSDAEDEELLALRLYP